MKLWHLARQHVNSDSGAGHAPASLSSPRRTRPALSKTEAMKDSWRPVVKADVTKRNGARKAVMINSHVGYFHLTEKPRSGHSPRNEQCPPSSRKDSLGAAVASSFFDNVRQKMNEGDGY